MRKNIINLSTTEWNAVVAAFNRAKSNGVYDEFTRRHQQAMMDVTRFANETGTQRNVAHKGPSFLPWHRELLLEFENAIGVHLPYWNWEIVGNRWQTSGIWNMIGGNGNSSQGYRVTNGPFANWTSIIFSNGRFSPRPGIIRRWATGGTLNSVAITTSTYDIANWNEYSDTTRSFRRQLESAHNTVHNLIGGDMAVGTSPNDPVFWFHHCNVERIYWRWQARHGYNIYQPQSGGPPAHNVNDNVRHLRTTRTIASLLDPRPLGRTYDTLG